MNPQQAFAAAVDCLREGRLAEAENLGRELLAALPGNAEVLQLLGLIADAAGRREEAGGLLRQAVAADPANPHCHVNLGANLLDSGRVGEAIDEFHRAIRLKPDFAQAHYNLANAEIKRGRAAEAIREYREAIRFEPGYAEAHYNLANTLAHEGELDAAVASYEAALRARPDKAAFYNNLGLALQREGRLDEAIAAYRRGLELAPRHGGIHSNLVYAGLFHPHFTAADLAAELGRWRQQHAAALRPAASLPAVDASLGRRLRIGFVSPNFREHVVGRNLLPLFRHYDREQFDFVCYSDVEAGDEITARFRALAAEWHEAAHCSDEELTNRIRQDRIDILIDVTLHMARNRLLVFARQAAPIQVTFAGYPGSTGLETMDYRLTDDRLDPWEQDGSLYTEESVRLRSFWCFDPLEASPPIQPLPALKNGFVTFGSLNNFAKVNEETIAAWARVLGEVVGSRLILSCPRGQSRHRVLAQLARLGVLSERVRFVDRQPRCAYLELHQEIDIILDAYPYNGHSTTLDALWMGAPVVSRAGSSPVARGGLSILSTASLADLAASTEAEYIDKAVELAADLPRLAALRQTLRSRMQASPLMDARGWTDEIQAVFRSIFLAQIGGSLADAGRPDEAAAICEQAIALRPDLSRAHYNLGMAKIDRGDMEAAVSANHHAIRCRPNHPAAYHNLALALTHQGRADEALASFQIALQAKPNDARIYNNLGAALQDLGRLDEAMACYRKACSLAPAQSQFHSNLLYAGLFHPNHTPRLAAQAHADWNRIHAEPLRIHHRAHGNDRSPDRPLRVGFVSPNLRDHVVGRNILPWFENRDRDRLAFVCYSDAPRPDALTTRLRSLASDWRETQRLSDEELAAAIREDRIDILFDLTLHMARSRLPVFARKPAPVQVTFAGYPGSTGLTAMDYRMTDRFLDPAERDDALYSEKSIRLDSFWCFDPIEPSPPVQGLPAFEKGFVTFGSLNNFAKVNDSMAAVWARVLLPLPASRFRLLAPVGEPRQRILALFNQHGITAERIDFVAKLPRADYLALHRGIDLILDTFPYNGHSTTLDALWMGVPVVSLAGESALSRGGLSILNNVGLPELVAQSPDAYVGIARALAADLPRLSALRGVLREKMLASPLMAAREWSRQLETACRMMWNRWVQSAIPHARSIENAR